MATILSSCVTTSARKEWSAVTTVPPLLRIAMVVVPPASLGRVLRVRNLSVWSILHDVRGRCESAFQDKPLASHPDRLVKSLPRRRVDGPARSRQEINMAIEQRSDVRGQGGE